MGQEARGRRQETGDRRQEAGGRRQEAGEQEGRRAGGDSRLTLGLQLAGGVRLE